MKLITTLIFILSLHFSSCVSKAKGELQTKLPDTPSAPPEPLQAPSQASSSESPKTQAPSSQDIKNAGPVPIPDPDEKVTVPPPPVLPYQAGGPNITPSTPPADPSETKLSTTSLVCYGVENNSIKKEWAHDANGFLKFKGYWGSESFSVPDNYFQIENSKKELLESCRKSLSMQSEGQIYFTASNSSLGYEYPILIPGSSISPYDNENTFDWQLIKDYAKLAKLVYSLADPKKEKTLSNFTPDGYKEIKRKIDKQSNMHAMAFENEKNKTIVISFKGTDFANLTDVKNGASLFIQNLFTTPSLKKAFSEALSFYRDVKNIAEAKEFSIVLTGDSLGAHLAINVAIHSGENARVFDAPATRLDNIKSNFGQWISQSMPMPNVINFVREWDPFVKSGKHVENMVYFQADKSWNPMQLHSLKSFITEIFDKTPMPNPTAIYVRPDASTGHGLNYTINQWGLTSQQP